MVDVSRITTTATLLEALDRRAGDAAAKKAFDDAIWAARGREAAILVTDLSGFTKLTKRHGILHFLQVFRRCEQTCMPIVHDHRGTLMKHEADDLVCIFEGGPHDALGAAFSMLRACAKINASLDEDEHVNLCIGVEHGRLLRLDDDAFGDPVNVAFKLGEDVAERGEVLIGPTAYAAAQNGFDFSGITIDGPRVVETGNVPLEHWSARIAP